MISNYRLNHTYNQLLKETEVLQTDHKNLKSLLNNSKLEQTRLEAEFSKLKEQYQQLDITSTKLNNQCEVSFNKFNHYFLLQASRHGEKINDYIVMTIAVYN